jgi:uncharacterized protein
MTDLLDNKLARLREVIDGFHSVLVACSGGVDSVLVMAVAHEQLGARALACVGVSPSYPSRELQQLISLASERSFAYRIVNTDEHLDPQYTANGADRCYVCKSHLHGRLSEIARAEGWHAIADGVNADDLTDHAGGIAAAKNFGVRSPLLETGLGKTEVRQLARYFNLPVWNKPASPCLASRVPHGTPVTPQLLTRIEAVENALAGLGFTQFRVRHHGDIARIELQPNEMERAVARREAIVGAARRAGYRFVALDLEGFRSGSLNGDLQNVR